MAVAQLAASLALYGDAQRSEATFTAALQLARNTPEYDWSRSDYGSRLRDGAAMLALAAESKPMPSVVPELITHRRGRTRRDALDEHAGRCLDAACGARAAGRQRRRLQLTVNGAALHRRLLEDGDRRGPCSPSRSSSPMPAPAPIQAVVTTVAAPAQPLPAGGDGFTIERTYYRLDGSEANVTEVTQNERFVVVLKVTEQNDWPSRVLVNDLLPAGFEIDNPRLVSSADLANFGWLQRTDAAHLEFRDDRFIAAFDRERRQRPRHHARLCGARGDARRLRRIRPPASRTCTGRNISARTSTGMMEVKAP